MYRKNSVKEKLGTSLYIDENSTLCMILVIPEFKKKNSENKKHPNDLSVHIFSRLITKIHSKWFCHD